MKIVRYRDYQFYESQKSNPDFIDELSKLNFCPTIRLDNVKKKR